VNLPEQLFGDNFVEFRHIASDTKISFNALDALRDWRNEENTPVRVAGSAAWMRSRKQEVEASNAKVLEYDWTFTTRYGGTLVQRGNSLAPQDTAACADSRDHPAVTFGWQPTARSIDRQLLMARDPILLYDEVPLFESELDDNGISSFSVKVRVMDRCWLCLARFWLRVDGTMVRLRETRLFCRLDEPDLVIREVRHCEASMQELREAGAPSCTSSYGDADAASETFLVTRTFTPA